MYIILSFKPVLKVIYDHYNGWSINAFKNVIIGYYINRYSLICEYNTTMIGWKKIISYKFIYLNAASSTMLKW